MNSILKVYAFMIKKISDFKLRYLILIFLLLLGGINEFYAQCPTVTLSTQSFCDIDAPTISDLVATDNGNGIQWYDTAVSVTPLASALALIDGEDYYADDNSGTCGVRERVDVIIYGPPTGFNFQGVCVDDPNDATISDLNAVGNNVQWYDMFSGGTPLAPTTVLVDNTIYYADQENPDTGCKTSRLSVMVIVGIVPVPTGDPIQTFCSNTSPTVADLVASGADLWYSTVSSVIPLNTSELLIDGEDYFATSVDPPCESIDRLQVTVFLDEPADPGVNGNLDICITQVPIVGSIDLINELSGSPDPGGTWSGPLPTSNGDTGTVDITTMTVSGSPYVFTYTVDPGNTCAPSTSNVTINITPLPIAGTNGSIDICTNDAPQNLFNSLGGTPDSGGTWSPVMASGTGIFDPNVDPAGVYTYTVTGTPPCGDASATVTVAIVPEPIAGTNGSLDICNNDAPQDLFNSLGGTPDPGGTWSPAMASGTGVFDPTVDPPGAYTYTVAGNPPCADASATVNVVIVPEPNAGEDTNAVLCINDGPQDLINFLNGNPDIGGAWSPSLASGTSVFDPNVDPAGAYIYTVGPTTCNQSASAILTVSIEANLDASGLVILAEDICLNFSNDIDLTGAILLPDGDYTVMYELSGSNSIQSSITITFTNGNSTFNIPANELLNSGTTTLTIVGIIPITSTCSADISLTTSIDFTIYDDTTPEIIDNGNTFCEEDEATIEDLSANILGSNIITWFDNATGGTAYSNSTLLIDGETYYASALSVDGCNSIIRLEVTVTLINCPEDIIIPDGFSPNGDTINDDFDIVNIRELFPNFTLEIYNRYGNILYKGNKDTPNWDGHSHEGSFGNSEVPVGVYFYIINFNDGITNSIQGRVYLSR